MRIGEIVRSIIRKPVQPTVVFFGEDGSRKDATEELRICFAGPVEIDPSAIPIEFARKVQIALDMGNTTAVAQTTEPTTNQS